MISRRPWIVLVLPFRNGLCYRPAIRRLDPTLNSQPGARRERLKWTH